MNQRYIDRLRSTTALNKLNRACPPNNKVGITRSWGINSLVVVGLGVSALYATPAFSQDTGFDEIPEFDEIIVTAAHRKQSIQDIPYNITVVTDKLLENTGVSDFSGLARLIPGVAIADTGARGNSFNNPLIMRGLNANTAGGGGAIPSTSSQTVSTYLNESPIFFNLKIADIERVEVLRGPQGTLYGSGSVGGTLRFVYNRPDAEAFSAKLQTSIGQSKDSGNLNYSVDGVVNLPISDNLALRVSAGYENIGGFVDSASVVVTDAGGVPILADPANPLTSGMVFRRVEDADQGNISYVRASLLLDVTENISAMFTYHRQEDDIGEFSGQSITGDPGAIRRENRVFALQPLKREVDLVSFDVDVDFGFASLTSATTYSDNDSSSVIDLTGLIEGLDLSNYYGGFPRIYSPTNTFTKEETFTQEVRLVSNSDGAWDWLVGFYYQDFKQNVSQVEPLAGFGAWATIPNNPAAEYYLGAGASWADFLGTYLGVPLSHVVADINFTSDRVVKTNEYALFGELTYHLTDAWQVTGGVRVFWQDFSQNLIQTLPQCGPGCSADFTDPRGITVVGSSTSFQDQIFKFNTSYDLNDNTMIFFTYAEGFRRGGGNALLTTGPLGEDPSLLVFEPDTAINYEIGVKGKFADRVTYSLGLYRIDWENVQITSFTVPGGFEFVANGNAARSQGVELAVNVQVSERFDVTFGYSYTDAVLTADFVAESTIGFKGDRLVGVPETQISVSMDYLQPISTDSALRFHLDGSYRSGTNTNLNAGTSNFAELGGFSIWNASVTWNRDDWKFGVFIKNITDEDGITGIAKFNVLPHNNTELLSLPRTVGVRASYSF